MTRKPNSEQTVRAKLNEIADHWVTHGEFPEDTSASDVQELSHVLYEEVEDHLNVLIADTTLTLREAEVWVLTKQIDEYHPSLTTDAVALLLAAPTTGFGNPAGIDEESTTSQLVRDEEIERHVVAAKKKINKAKQTIGAVTFPNRHEVFTSPELVWLNLHTIQRLQNQRHSAENTLNDVITRLLDETETRRSVKAYVRGYLSARGKNNVNQVAILRQSFETGTLLIIAYTAVQDDLPDIVTETDAVIHHGHRYDVHFLEDPNGPQENGSITLYSSGSIDGMDAVLLEDGLAAADEHMQELLDRDEPLPTRIIE